MFIERTAWWRGAVNRGDLREVFGISAAQASADLQGYLELNPGALAYNLSTKRYEAQQAMRCVLHESRLEDAVRGVLGGSAPMGGISAAKVEVVATPQRRAPAEVERRVFLALDQGRRLEVKYWSVNSGGGRKREIAPHALGHDGLRWHVRAWCFENGDFRDFTLSRIEDAEWPGDNFTPPVADEQWEKEVPVVLRANRSLDEERRKAVERDFGMTDGRLELRVREAMRGYLLAHLRMSDGGETWEPLLEEE